MRGAQDRDEWGRGGRQEEHSTTRDSHAASTSEPASAAAGREDQFADSDDEEDTPAAGAAVPADTSALPMVPAGLEHLGEEELLAQLMGLQGFDSSKGQEVPDNKYGAAKGGVRKNQVRKHRQYMNRKDGFNRPLDRIK